jgi:hypothetical protein
LETGVLMARPDDFVGTRLGVNITFGEEGPGYSTSAEHEARSLVVQEGRFSGQVVEHLMVEQRAASGKVARAALPQ